MKRRQSATVGLIASLAELQTEVERLREALRAMDLFTKGVHTLEGEAVAQLRSIISAALTGRDASCARCGHSSDDHRIDDYAGIRGEPIDPTDPATKFRCSGHEENGKWVDTECDCPDFVEAVAQLRSIIQSADDEKEEA